MITTPKDPAAFDEEDCYKFAITKVGLHPIRVRIIEAGARWQHAKDQKEIAELCELVVTWQQRHEERTEERDKLQSELQELRAEKMFPIQSDRKYGKAHPTLIPWQIADLAYSGYSAKCGRDQSLQRLAERGGFGPFEMDMFLPDWISRCDERNKLQAELAAKVTAIELERRLGGIYKQGLAKANARIEDFRKRLVFISTASGGVGNFRIYASEALAQDDRERGEG